MGLLPVRSGRVAFRDRDITRLPAHERALLGIGYAPEDCGIFPDLSVEENFQITAWLGQAARSEEHTSELQSQSNLVCRLLLEKKKLPRSGHPRALHPIHSPRPRSLHRLRRIS